MPLTRLFRSRWSALLWAGGVLWTAHDVAAAYDGPAPQGRPTEPARDATGTTVEADDLAVLANAGG